MKKDYTHIVVLLDKSGSMSSIKNDVIGGFNSFLDSQKLVKGNASVSLYQFDDKCEKNYEFLDIKFIKDLDSASFIPRGSTALYDAMGEVINNTGELLANLKESERPEKVIFLIITDGEENSSKRYHSYNIKKMVEHQINKYNWEFVFIGANQNSILNAERIGIDKRHSVNFDTTSLEIKKMYSTLSHNITSSRIGNLVNYNTGDKK